MSNRREEPHGARSPWGSASFRLQTSIVGWLFCVVAAACVHPPRTREESGADAAYPMCDGAPSPAGDVDVTGALRAGPTMLDRSLVERFEVRRRGCLLVFRGEQEWSRSSTDLDVVFDASSGRPLRAWKRVVAPGPQPIEERTSFRRFSVADTGVRLTQRMGRGALEHWRIRGQRPTAIIGPGRGLLTMWLRRARLPVGGRTREPVLDLRESMEVVRDVTLSRLDDQFVEGIGRRVRVYTIFGREPFFADENDVVVGDLMGLVPADRVAAPMPPPLPEPGPVDPVGTP